MSADSYLNALVLPWEVAGTSIIGNGHTVSYDAGNPANIGLGGKTYVLAGGGLLRPMGRKA